MTEDATQTLAVAVANELATATTTPPTVVVGIGGGVGVGKTTLANALAARLRDDGKTVAILTTDNFLLPNARLAEAGLMMKKGFPESYDVEALVAAVACLRGGESCAIPLYDHQTYDIVASTQEIAASDVLIVEGVNALQPSVAVVLDIAVYVDADEADAEAWFHTRFEELSARGEGFYAPFAAMTSAERRAVSNGAWSRINVVNLREHIAPTRDTAAYVVRKARDHQVVSITNLGAAEPSRARGADPS
jgi:type I pantothenate kinase